VAPRPLQSSGGTLLAANRKDQLASLRGDYADYGTWTWDEATGTATSHLLESVWPNLRGQDLKTHPRMEGDRFINTTDPIETGTGKSVVYSWTWEPIR